MESPEKISNQNKQWYLVEIIEKFEPVGRNKTSDLRRVITWGNMHLVKAGSAEEAYDKGMKIGKESEIKYINSDNTAIEWFFVGIGDLMLIHEDIEDGAELMWTNYGDITNKRAERFAKSKEELIANLENAER